MSEKMIVSKPGFDAGTETNPDNLVFSSDYSTLKYASVGTTTLVYGGGTIGTWSTTVNHGASFKPFTMCFVDRTSTGTYEMMPWYSKSLPRLDSFNVYTDGTKLNFVTIAANGVGTIPTGTATYKYFIFKNNTSL